MPSGKEGSTPQATCHPEVKAFCKGLCRPCYRRTLIEAGYDRKWYSENLESCKKSQRAYSEKPEVKEAKQVYHLNRKTEKTGWTAEHYTEVFEEQKGLCAICKQPSEKTMDRDHEHVDPPKPRGLLCRRCNVAIGLLMENTEYLLSAVAYLNKWGEGKDSA